MKKSEKIQHEINKLQEELNEAIHEENLKIYENKITIIELNEMAKDYINQCDDVDQDEHYSTKKELVERELKDFFEWLHKKLGIVLITEK